MPHLNLEMVSVLTYLGCFYRLVNMASKMKVDKHHHATKEGKNKIKVIDDGIDVTPKVSEFIIIIHI